MDFDRSAGSLRLYIEKFPLIMFWPKGHNLNKLDRGSLDDATYIISRLYSMPSGFRQDFFSMFSLYKPM